MQVGTLMPERSHKYFELKLWASENAAICSAHVSLDMSRKTFGGWGFAPNPDSGAHIAPDPSSLRGRDRGFGPLRHLRHAPMIVLRLWLIVYRTELTVSLSVGGARGMAGAAVPCALALAPPAAPTQNHRFLKCPVCLIFLCDRFTEH